MSFTSTITDVEKSLIGSLMKMPEVLDEISLPADAISDGPTFLMYKAMLGLQAAERPINEISVSAVLELEGLASPRSSLVATIEDYGIPSRGAILDHAKILQEKYRVARLTSLLQSGANLAKKPDATAAELLAYIENSLDAVDAPKSAEPIERKEMSKRFRDALLSGQPRPKPFQTRIEGLNHLISGFFPGGYTIIAAPPSWGKTALAYDTLVFNANMGLNGLYIGLDQNWEAMVERDYLAVTDLDQCGITRVDRNFNESERHQINQAFTEHQSVRGNIYISDNASMSIADIRSLARSMKRRHNIGIIVIDYVQQIFTPGRSETRNQEISQISSRLKALALELNIAVVALSQLSRAYDSLESGCRQSWEFPRIKLSHLRDSGSLEADASMVISILNKPKYVEGRYGTDSQAYCQELARYSGDLWGAELAVLKNKNGRTGTVKCCFDPKRMRFVSPALGVVENDPKDLHQSSSGDRRVNGSRRRGLAPEGALF